MCTKLIAALFIVSPILAASAELDLGARQIVKKRLFDTYYNSLYWGMSEQYKSMGVPEPDHPCIITPIVREIATCHIDALAVSQSPVFQSYYQWLSEGARDSIIFRRIGTDFSNDDATSFLNEYKRTYEYCLTGTFERYGLWY